MTTTRAAIVGTASSWQLTPWNDPGLHVCSLNDAYQIKGFQRADEWYDTHPIRKMYFRPAEDRGPVYAHQIPVGAYVRPAHHLEWLKAQTIPVWLHPDYTQDHPDAATWLHAHAFPKAEIEAHFGRYFSSSPQWMLAHLMLRGYRDVSVYGIHLATEHEYIEQRPGFEFLLGRMLGPGKLTVSVKDQMRHYETPEGHLALPEASPVLTASFQYGYEPRPLAGLEPLRWEAHKLAIKRTRALGQLRGAKWWTPTAAIKEELWRLDALQMDLDDEMGRIQMGGR